MHQKLEKTDAILVLGGRDLRVAEYAAQLFLDGQAPVIIFSGGRGRGTTEWELSEAETFANAAIKMGVPKEKILIENTSANTGENIIFTRKLLNEKGLSFNKCIVVHKPYMERRTWATFKKVWPEQDILVASPPFTYETYADKNRSKEETLSVMLRDLQKIKIYAERGFQIPQEIPNDVWQAYEILVAEGYSKHPIP